MDTQSIKQKIEYKTERIKKLRSEIKQLEHKRMQLENEEIIKTVNNANIPISELKNLLTTLKERKQII